MHIYESLNVSSLLVLCNLSKANVIKKIFPAVRQGTYWAVKDPVPVHRCRFLFDVMEFTGWRQAKSLIMFE